MTTEPTSDQTAAGDQLPEQLPEQLHQILQEWSQLITSLSSLIRENVEGLLPAVFNLANLASRTSEARIEATGSARQAGASLRDRAAELNAAMQPLAEVARENAGLRASMAELARQADALKPRAGEVDGLDRLLSTLSEGPGAVLPQMQKLLDRSEAVEASGGQALAELTSGLDIVESLLHADTAEIEAAAGRVRHFAESSRAAIDQLLVKLQFQDRTDQILSHLLADFESLSTALNEVGEQPFDVDAWRTARSKRFTTNEERNAGQAPPSTDPGDIELF